jgi:Putative porin
MIKIANQKSGSQVAIFAGAAALMAWIPQSSAQSSVDALLNKLEQKGILSVDEARELKAENDEGSAQDFNKALGAKFPMPDWVTSYKLYGDFRGRFDDVSTDIPAFGGPNGVPKGENNNIRWRYRLRVGLTVNMRDDLQVGFRLGSDDAYSGNNTGGNPLSNNSTFQGNASKKFLYVDTAYGKWTMIDSGTWMIAATIGKMDLPFEASPMVFDPDYTPEGAALRVTYKINDNHSLAFNGAVFVLDQANSRSPYLYGGQVIWKAAWSPKIVTSLGVAVYDIANDSSFPASNNQYSDTPYDSNLGNTLNAINIPTFPNPTTGYTFASHFNPVVASGSVTYTLDNFPLYAGAFPIQFAGEYMNNPAAGNKNQGWWAGVTLGKSAKKGQWDISYRYQYLEADAWWDQLVDDDNIAVFPDTSGNIPTSNTAAGGTNIKGHLIKFDYSIFDSLTFTFTAYINELVSNPVSGADTGAVHAMADLMWKF